MLKKTIFLLAALLLPAVAWGEKSIDQLRKEHEVTGVRLAIWTHPKGECTECNQCEPVRYYPPAQHHGAKERCIFITPTCAQKGCPQNPEFKRGDSCGKETAEAPCEPCLKMPKVCRTCDPCVGNPDFNHGDRCAKPVAEKPCTPCFSLCGNTK